MKWITHQTIAVLGAAAMQLPPPAVALAWAGSTLPDSIDFFLVRMGCNFNRIHRGHSHLWLWYVLAFVPLMFLGLPDEVVLGAFGFFFGVMSHILTDFITMSGVPYSPCPPIQKRRVGLALVRTGSVTEYLFLAGFVAVMVVWQGRAVFENYQQYFKGLL